MKNFALVFISAAVTAIVFASILFTHFSSAAEHRPLRGPSLVILTRAELMEPRE